MSRDGRTALAVLGLIAGLALGLLVFGPILLRNEARDDYEHNCTAVYSREPIDVAGCDHERGEWHAP